MDVLYLFRKYRDDVYRLAANYTHNPQEAEDVCQTVFLKLLEQGELRPGKEKAWMMQVTVNLCRDLLKSSWWQKTAPLEESMYMAQSENDETLQALKTLPPNYRVVLYLRYYEELTSPEIARLLQIPVSTVTTRVARGREKLKKILEEG